MRLFAQFVSYLLHPMLMPTYLLLLVYSTDTYLQLATPANLHLVVTLLVFISSCLLPGFGIILLQRNGLIKSLQMETREERRIPFLITAIFYFLTFYLLRQVQLPSLVPLLLLGATFALVLTMLINLKWKISAHMVGIGGVIGAIIGLSMRLFVDYRLIIMILIIVAGLIGSSRMLLNAHSPAQIYFGFGVGISSQLLLFLLL